MTTIIGVRLGDTVAIAADRRSGVNGGRDILSEETAKLIHCGPWVLDGSGTHRLSIVVEEHAERLASAQTIYGFVEILRGLVEADGWKLAPAENGPADMGSLGLVIARGSQLWYCGSAFCYVEMEQGRPVATGTGCEWAEGAALVALRYGASAAEAACAGVEVAAQFDAFTGPTHDLVELGVEVTDACAYARATACAQGENKPNGSGGEAHGPGLDSTSP